MEKRINLKIVLYPDIKMESYYNLEFEKNTEILLRRFALSMNNCKTVEEQCKVISSIGLVGGRNKDAELIAVYDAKDNKTLCFYQNNYNEKTGNYARGKLIKTITL